MAVPVGLGISNVASAELPKATQAILKKAELGTDVLKGLDAELVVPKEWIDGARKEGTLSIGGTWDEGQFQVLASPFRERYPFVKIKYARATRYDRVVKPLMAFKAGRVPMDIISGIGAKFTEFQKLDAIENLTVLPNWKNVPDGMKHPDGLWIGQRLRYWCMSYNTNALKKADLPKTWDDILTNTRLHNGKIGMGNRPNLWLLNLWDIKGEQAIREYAEKLFHVVKPQLRKEGMNALISLAVAGEFDMTLPSAAYRTKQMLDRGAPIAWHCPEPVPLAISEMLVVKGGHRNASLLYVNWFMSKEGQVAQFAANQAPPVHRELQTKEFLPFPDEVAGKKVAFRSPDKMEEDLPELMKIWDPLWLKSTGEEVARIKAKLDKVGSKGRDVTFKAGRDVHTAKISGSRTKITIAGAPGKRAALKAGMTCEIVYTGNKTEAKEIACN